MINFNTIYADKNFSNYLIGTLIVVFLLYDKFKQIYSMYILKNLIEKWRYINPNESKLNEKKLVKELSLHLIKHNYKVHREYRDRDNSIDLVVYLGNNIGFGCWFNRINIEVKYNLTKKASYDRLVGQIVAMSECSGIPAVLLLGKLDCNMLSRIIDLSKKIDNPNFYIMKNTLTE